jgi:SEC-C motif-containing protein
MVAACPCGSGKTYVTCCGLRHSGMRPAETAEDLMRARYSAYVMGKGDYLVATQGPAVASEGAQALSEWGRSVRWLGLKVLRTERGQAGDARGTVEFEARFEQNGREVVQHEVSRFDKVNGQWRYISGRSRHNVVL